MNLLRLSLATFAALPFAALTAAAQSPAAAAQPSSPASNLQQLEATYQSELKKIHVPLLSAYVTELNRLAAQSRNAEVTTAINRELRLIQNIIVSGGVVDLTQPPGAPEAPGTPRPQGPPAGSLFTLTPATAREFSPAPAGSPAGESAPVLKAVWNLGSIGKGRYELICQGYLAALDLPTSLKVHLAGQSLIMPLARRHIAVDAGALRVIKIGELDVPENLAGTDLTLSVEYTGTPPAAPTFHLRQVFLTRARGAPGTSAN